MSRGSIECIGLGVDVARGPRLATVTAHFLPGRFTAILGPNGAGKSTLLAQLVGERAAQSGEIIFDGLALAHHQPEQVAVRRAVMPQDCSVAFDFTALEVVELGRYPHRHQPSRDDAHIVREAMRLTGVEHLAHRSINTLSGGERARTHLARALAQVWEQPKNGDARWLLLDEPTAALDLAHQHHSMALLRGLAAEQCVGVIAVVHDVNLAVRYAHDALILDRDKSVHGPVNEVLVPQTIRDIWGVSCTLVAAEDGVPQFLFHT